MELEDAAYPLLQNIYVTSDANEAFQDAEAVILLGGFPRRPGMERSDLIEKNTAIFRAMGPALESSAQPDVKVLVVANPANTNCLTLMEVSKRLDTFVWPVFCLTAGQSLHAQAAPSIPRENFTALMRLDHNRAGALVSRQINSTMKQGRRRDGVIENASRVSASDVTNVVIWGNHSRTQYPDLNHAVITLRSHRASPVSSILAKGV